MRFVCILGAFVLGCSGPTGETGDGGTPNDANSSDSASSDDANNPMMDSGPPCTFTPVAPTGAFDPAYSTATVDVKSLNSKYGSFDVGIGVVDGQGRTTVLGKAFILLGNGYEYRFASVRVGSDGKLDTGYGAPYLTNPANVAEFATPSVAVLDSSERVLVGGIANVSNNTTPFVMRLDGSGAIDSGFGFHPLAPNSSILAMVTEGSDVWVSSNVKTLQHFHGDGSIDGSFQPQAGAGQFSAIALTKDCVLTSTASSEVRCLKRSDGTLSPSFGTAGIATLPKTTLSVDTLGILVQPNGRIVVARGESYSKKTDLVALTSTGAADTSFTPRTVPVYFRRSVMVCDHTIGGSVDTITSKLSLAHVDSLGMDVGMPVTLDTMGASFADHPVFDRSGRAQVTIQLQTGSAVFSSVRANPP